MPLLAIFPSVSLVVDLKKRKFTALTDGKEKVFSINFAYVCILTV